MDDHAYLAGDALAAEPTKNVAKAGVSTFARFVHAAGESFGIGLAAAKYVLADTARQAHARAKTFKHEVLLPRVKQEVP